MSEGENFKLHALKNSYFRISAFRIQFPIKHYSSTLAQDLLNYKRVNCTSWIETFLLSRKGVVYNAIDQPPDLHSLPAILLYIVDQVRT